jgi:hypothetical protein
MIKLGRKRLFDGNIEASYDTESIKAGKCLILDSLHEKANLWQVQ